MDFVRAANGYDVDAASDAAGLECRDPSLTIQSQAQDADINVIVKRFGLTGQLPQVLRPPSYEDFSESVDDYRSALDLVAAADASFMKMPAEVRKRFDNDPAEFVDFCNNPDNLEEMKKLGLVDVVAPVVPAVVVPAKP